MNLPASIFIGLRYSKSQSKTGFVSFITFFSIAGILLGVASLITVVSVMNGFEGELKKRILGLVPHVVISNKADTQHPLVSWQSLRKELMAQPFVNQVTPFTESEALIQSASALQGVLMLGINPDYEQNNIISTHMISGQLANLSREPWGLVLGEVLARKLKLRLGDSVRIVLPNKMTYTPMGRMPVQRVFKISGIFYVGSEVDDSMVFIDSRYAAKLFKRRDDGVTHLRLYLDDAFHAKSVGENLPLDTSKYQVTTWSQSQGALFSAVRMEKNMMWLMLSLIIAVAAFNIVSALVMVVIDKQGEIGILQTLGMNTAGITKIFITQGLVNGIWGTLIGATLGIVISLNLNTILSTIGVSILGEGYETQNLPVQLEWINVVVIIVGALAMSFLATLYPAYKASNTEPAEVLRNE